MEHFTSKISGFDEAQVCKWQGIWWPWGGCVEQGYMHPHLKIHHPNWHPQENPRTEEAWRLNYGLTPRGGPSRSELRHSGRAVWRILHCCYPCWTCSMDKFRTLVSSAVKLAPFTSTKFTFKRRKKKKGNKILVIYYEFSLVNTARWPAEHSLRSLVLQREGGSGWLAGWQGHSVAPATRGLPAAFQSDHPRHLPGKDPAKPQMG